MCIRDRCFTLGHKVEAVALQQTVERTAGAGMLAGIITALPVSYTHLTLPTSDLV